MIFIEIDASEPGDVRRELIKLSFKYPEWAILLEDEDSSEI